MNKKRFILDLVIIAVLVILDQLSKKLAVLYLMDKPAFEIIPGILELYYLPGGNKGAAWGMLSGHQVLFVIISSAVVLAILYMLLFIPSESKYLTLRILLVFIASGGIGNMIDRVVLGYVIDFIYIRAINFPIFNVADMYVSCSIVILLLIFLFRYKDEDIKELEGYLKRKKDKISE